PLDIGRDPGLDPPEEIDPVGGGPPGVRRAERLAGRRAGRPEDVALAAPPVVDLPPRAGAGLGRDRDHLPARAALGRLGPQLIEADHRTARRWRRVEGN